jgi:hypothetical protein
MSLEHFKNNVAGRYEDFLILARLGEGACPQRPVTEPKRSQKRKEPFPNGYSIF